MKALIDITSDWIYYGDTRVANPRHVSIGEGVTVLVGPNGAGKSTVANVIDHARNFRTNRLVERRPGLKVAKVEFNDIHSLSTVSASYYQQRYEATMNDEIATVAEALGDTARAPEFREWCESLGLTDVAGRKVNFLSSGELRKLLIARALCQNPGLLILDNPYIGLDASSRQALDKAIASLPALGVSVMLTVADPADIPECADTVIPVKEMELLEPVVRTRPIAAIRDSMMSLFDYAIDTSKLPRSLSTDNEPVETVIAMRRCNVSYGPVTVIDSLDWTVRDGEHWALAGPNGSGKSTLLSLVTADHPRCYDNDITLFDRRRGTGESIWDIKRRIGYISPEMQLYFNGSATVADVIARGLSDTRGNFGAVPAQHAAQARQWMEMLHLESLARRRFATLSTGERQLVLLARAMIKQPRLLVLDEPAHGLDYARRRAVRALINHFAARAAEPGSPHPVTIIYVTHYASEIPECITHTKTLSRPNAPEATDRQ